MNKLVVIARLDPAGDAYLAGLKQAAHALQHKLYPNSADWPPHITLAAYEDMDEAELCAWTAACAAKHTPFSIRFDELRIFPRPPHLETEVIYAAPAPSGALTALHRTFHTRYDEFCGAYGRESARADYTFHSTVTICHADDTPAILARLQQDLPLPTARVVALEVYRNPCAFVARYELNGRASAPVAIHPTRPDEAEALALIQKAAFQPLYDRYHDEGNPCLRGTEDILCRLNRSYRHYTVTACGKIVGGILYRLHGKRRPYDDLKAGEYYLGRVYVHPDYQNQGIAAEAIRLCEREFPDAMTYYVDFPADLEKNRRCYEKVGFFDMGMESRTPGEPVLSLYEKRVDPAQAAADVRHPQIFDLTEADLPEALTVIHESFATVAAAFGLTRENCPRHTCFLPPESLQARMAWGWRMYGLFAGKQMIGYVSLSEGEGGVWEIHNLAVLPPYRHRGFGKRLLDHAKAMVRGLGGKAITLGLIHEDTRLKSWYAANGFTNTGVQKFDHLPFTVGYMEWKENS